MLIDKSILKANYSRMTNEELIRLMQTEGQDLTKEALSALQETFSERKLNMIIFTDVENNKIAHKQQLIKEAQESGSTEFINSIWNYAFDRKREGKLDKEIQKGIMGKGLDEEHSNLIIKTLESKARQIADAHDTDMLVGGLICAIGIGITLWTYSASLNGGSYIVAWGAILFGAIRFFRGLSNKGKYKEILKNILSERNIASIIIVYNYQNDSRKI